MCEATTEVLCVVISGAVPADPRRNIWDLCPEECSTWTHAGPSSPPGPSGRRPELDGRKEQTTQGRRMESSQLQRLRLSSCCVNALQFTQPPVDREDLLLRSSWKYPFSSWELNWAWRLLCVFQKRAPHVSVWTAGADCKIEQCDNPLLLLRVTLQATISSDGAVSALEPTKRYRCAFCQKEPELSLKSHNNLENQWRFRLFRTFSRSEGCRSWWGGYCLLSSALKWQPNGSRAGPEPQRCVTRAAEFVILKGMFFSRESVRSIFTHAFKNFPTGYVFTHDETAIRWDENIWWQ